jgi:hypothetical protein
MAFVAAGCGSPEAKLKIVRAQEPSRKIKKAIHPDEPDLGLKLDGARGQIAGQN